MNSVKNPKNYRIFSPNPKTDGMKAQPYSDWFLRHHISFSYQLAYLPNNTKIIKKYGKWNWNSQKFYRWRPCPAGDGDGDSACVHAQRLEAPPHSELVLHVDHVSCVVLKRKTWEKYSVGIAFDFWPGFLYWANQPDYEIQTPPNWSIFKKSIDF
jgi:hypothetical protein